MIGKCKEHTPRSEDFIREYSLPPKLLLFFCTNPETVPVSGRSVPVVVTVRVASHQFGLLALPLSSSSQASIKCGAFVYNC